ncbi:Uncharacterised protein [uncultured archaeon]|nr:Uncharacterised protein [uncultured archaeon]
MKNEIKYNSCWYNRLQSAIYFLAFLTYGIGDSLTSLWMSEQYGIIREANPILRYIILNFSPSTYLEFKISLTLVILLAIFFIQINSKEPVYWTVNGCLISFVITGTLATVLNIRAGRNEAVFLSPEQVIFLFLILVFLLTSIGEEIDKRTQPIIKPFIDCLSNDIRTILALIINLFKKKS